MIGKFGERKFSNKQLQHAINTLHQLDDKLVSTRPGGGKSQFKYLEIDRAISLTNSAFSFKGWSSEVRFVRQDQLSQEFGQYTVTYTACVRVTLQTGCFHEDLGSATVKHPSKGDAIENAQKSAISDALKRCLRQFGEGVGLGAGWGQTSQCREVLDDDSHEQLHGLIGSLCEVVKMFSGSGRVDQTRGEEMANLETQSEVGVQASEVKLENAEPAKEILKETLGSVTESLKLSDIAGEKAKEPKKVIKMKPAVKK